MNANPVERLAEEAVAARRRFDATLSELGRRTDPKTIADEALETAREQGRRLSSGARTIASDHPIALGAGAVAVALALLAARQLKVARVDLGDDAEDYSGYSDYNEAYAGGSDPLDEPDPAPVASSIIGQHPLVSMVLGLAAGALIGLLGPHATRR